MVNFLLLLQILILVSQIYIGVAALRKEENVYTYYKGYAIWACIPNWIIMFMVLALS